MSDIAIAALLAGTVLVASTISIEIGLSVALIELLAGVVVGNAFHLAVPTWLGFLGSFAGILLTFQAGAEVDVVQFRSEWRASLSIGLVSFFAPFAVVAVLAYYGLDWSRRQAEIGGLALSTTSLAVVYAVLVETGLNRELVGKRLMSATFVTDIATVAGLTILFVKPTLWVVPFALVSLASIAALPRVATWFFVYSAVILSLVRGLPVVYDSWDNLTGRAARPQPQVLPPHGNLVPDAAQNPSASHREATGD